MFFKNVAKFKKTSIGEVGKHNDFVIDLEKDGVINWSKDVEFLYSISKLKFPKELKEFSIETKKINESTYKVIPHIKVVSYTPIDGTYSYGTGKQRYYEDTVVQEVNDYVDNIYLVIYWSILDYSDNRGEHYLYIDDVLVSTFRETLNFATNNGYITSPKVDFSFGYLPEYPTAFGWYWYHNCKGNYIKNIKIVSKMWLHTDSSGGFDSNCSVAGDLTRAVDIRKEDVVLNYLAIER